MNQTLNDIIHDASDVSRTGFGYVYLFLLLLVSGALVNTDISGMVAAMIIAVGVSLPFVYWTRARVGGLPFIQLYAVVNIAWYLLPVALDNEAIGAYSTGEWITAGIYVLLHFAFLLLGFHLTKKPAQRKRRSSVRTFDFIGLGDSPRKIHLLLVLFIGIVLLEWLRARTPIFYSIVPYSFSNVAVTFITVAASGTALLLSFNLSKTKSPVLIASFWVTWLFFVMIKASGLILSSTMVMIAATLVGIMLGKRKVPWLYILLVAVITAFLNQGKFELRMQYANQGAPSSLVKLYANWLETSYQLITDQSEARYRSGVESSGQSLFGDRLSNMQMLLFVQKRVQKDDYPRFIW